LQRLLKGAAKALRLSVKLCRGLVKAALAFQAMVEKRPCA
jgi:hypothetical protein